MVKKYLNTKNTLITTMKRCDQGVFVVDWNSEDNQKDCYSKICIKTKSLLCATGRNEKYS